MAIGGIRLGQIEPRERAGAQTGRKYEYQYERTARAALDLLVDGLKYVCVYCDWHDDYVVEKGDPPTRYVFHQVKGRKSSQGPWTFGEFFGVRRKKARIPAEKPASVKPDAIVPLMLSHHKNFGDNCVGLAFVTNTGVGPDLSGFLSEIAAARNETALPQGGQIAFQHIARAYMASDPQLAPSATHLFAWLRGLKIHTDQGQLDDPNAALLELADVVLNFSEIDLVHSQAKQIAREIVSRVRSKAACSSTVVPASDEQLRREKGIAVVDLLGDLSLSVQAYEQLKAGEGIDAVKTLSRLQRFCQKHKINNLESICGFKAAWDVWRTKERHFLASADYILLEKKAREALKAGMTIEKIVFEAKDIAKQFDGITGSALTAECVLGLIFSLAAQSEALPDARLIG